MKMSKGRKVEGRKSRLLAYALLLAGTANATPEELFKKGNRALAEKRFRDAAHLYAEAAAEAPELAELHYNLGHAQYRAGLFEAAAGTYEIAAARARTDTLRSRCRYNQGNCMVKLAEALRETEPQAAVEHCRQAAGLYRAALELNGNFPDAAYNLEISMRIAAGIEQQIRDRQEQQQNGKADEAQEESSDSDVACEESEQDAELYEAADPFGDFSEYEEIRGVPPPNKTEMDILAEEIQNQARRKKKKAGTYKAVDKDW